MNFYMFDAAVPKRTENLRLTLEHPRKWADGPMLGEEYFAEPSKPWEPRFDNGYPNVFYDAERHVYRCYYTQFTHDPCSADTPPARRAAAHYEPRAGRKVALAYAESRDGRHWVKPALGLVAFEGSADNNLLVADAHGASVFLDAEEPDPARRYKMLYRQDGGERLLVAAFSADGYRFAQAVVLEPRKRLIMADSHNFAFRAATGTYVLLSRHWERNLRVVTRMESEDFITWSAPEQVLCGQSRSDQIYSMPVFWFDGFYLGLASIFHDGDASNADFDCVDCELTYSVDTVHWHRVAPGVPFIRRARGAYPSGGPDAGCVYASVPVQAGNALHFYYMGGNGRHTDYRETSLLGATLRAGRFASFRAGDAPGLLETAALRLSPSDLWLDAACGQGSRIQAQVVDACGQAVPGYELAQSRLERRGDRWLARWQERAQLPEGTGLRLQFSLRRARLYSFACEAAFANPFLLGLEAPATHTLR